MKCSYVIFVTKPDTCIVLISSSLVKRNGYQNCYAVDSVAPASHQVYISALKGTLSRGFLCFGVKNVLKFKLNAFFTYTECS